MESSRLQIQKLMRRFYTHCIENGIVYFDEEEARHMIRVLRLGERDQVIALDGSGNEYVCEIDGVDKKGVTGKILEMRRPEVEAKTKITLYQACLKTDKMEFIASKATELGASALVPVLTERCVKIPQKAAHEKFVNKLHRASIEAVKQCRRVVPLAIEQPISLEALIKRVADSPLVVFAYESGGQPIKKVLRNGAPDVHQIGLICGPEGGFTEKEAEQLMGAGAKAVTLGKRILRAETAALTLIGCTMYEMDEMTLEEE